MRALLGLLMAAAPLHAAAGDGPSWQPLLDGVSTQGWHNVGKTTLDPRWRVIDGALVQTQAGGGDIISDATFGDFELEVEWQVAAGGNSGLFYRAVDAEPIWHRAVEFQLLDNDAAEDRFDPKHRAGAVYDLIAPEGSALKPIGEYNQARVITCGPRVEHWLNGVRVAAYDLDSEDWKRRVAGSKFAGQRDFGVARRGHIGFQDHGNVVKLRNIRIRAPVNCH